MRNSDSLRGLVDLCCYVRTAIGSNITVVEIGSFAGESSLEFALHFRKVVCIDTWDFPNSERIVDDGKVEEYFDKAMRYAGNISKIKGLSLEAAKQAKGIIDLLYVDGDHHYEAMAADLRAWMPLVRPGGFVAGHDYGDERFPGVERAVNEAVGKPDEIFGDKSWLKRLQ